MKILPVSHRLGGPDFLGIGAQKAGTTWLYTMLAMHPQIAFPQVRGRELKEVHFWDNKYHRGVEWYRSLYGGGKIMGDITPGYAILPLDRIREIGALNPSIPIIYTLRNPVERAWSAVQMRLRRGTVQRSGGADDYAFYIAQFEDPRVLRRGNYADTLHAWFSVFSRDQFLVLRYEQISSDPKGLVASCARHIGIDPSYYSSVPDTVLRERVGAHEGESLSRPFYDYLLARYHDQVLELESILGWDLSAWKVGYDEWLASRSRMPVS